MTGSRADTIAVLRIDPTGQWVAVLSLPRDLLVDYDGNSARLNTFTARTGLAEVVSSLLDVGLNHLVEVDFVGFESLIDLAGGVAIPFDTAVSDTATGFTASSGCNHLSGAETLAYVRSRRLEALDETTNA